MSLYIFKKRKRDFSLHFNLIQSLLDNNKVNTSDINNNKREFKTWFWYKSANKSYSNYKKKRYSNVDIKKSDLKRKKPSHKGLAR